MMAETSGGGGTEVGSGPEGGVAGGKVMLLRGKRPEEVGAWPLEEVVLLQYCPHADEEAVHVSDDLLRAFVGEESL